MKFSVFAHSRVQQFVGRTFFFRLLNNTNDYLFEWNFD